MRKPTPATKKPLGKAKKSYTEKIDDWDGPTQGLLASINFEFKCKNETQKELMNSIKTNDVTFCVGPSGTGKTLVSCAQALKLLKTNNYKRILITKSITQLKGEDIGILPGDVNDKLSQMMMSYIDAFHLLLGESLTTKFIEEGLIKFESIGAMRGRSFNDVILIADEFQNLSLDNAKTLLTRISENTKYILLGDKEQIDIKDKKDSSLDFLVSKIKESPVDGVGCIQFTHTDIVRHRLISYFLGLFK